MGDIIFVANVAGDLRSALVWLITSEVHSAAGNRQRRREVGYHGRLGKRGRGRGAHSEAKEWYVSSLRSTIEGSGSPFAGELHYLWASRGNELAPRTQTEQSNASSSDSAIQRRILGHNPPIYRNNAQHGVSETNPHAARFLVVA